MKLGNKIIKLRKENKLSQEMLADKIGVSRQTISNWELNITKPDAGHIKKMSKIFNISIDELLENDIRDIMEKKISNTEKITNKNMKSIRTLLITIYFIILTFLIWVIIYYSTKRDFTNKYQYVYVCTLEYEEGHIMKTDVYYLYWNVNEDGTYSTIIEASEENTVYSDDFPKGFYGEVILDDLNMGNSLIDAIEAREYMKNNYIYRGAVCR